jgi:hypothetical protein
MKMEQDHPNTRSKIKGSQYDEHKGEKSPTTTIAKIFNSEEGEK